MPQTKSKPPAKRGRGRPRREGGHRNEIVRFSLAECAMIDAALERLQGELSPPKSRADAIMCLVKLYAR